MKPMRAKAKDSSGRALRAETTDLSRRELRREYEMCFQRWMSLNGQVWQVPALAMTAQAFLFTIMLSSTTETAPRIVSAILSISVSIMSGHLLLRHRFHQIQDFNRMALIETRLGLSPFTRGGWDKTAEWADAYGDMTGKNRWQHRRLPGSSVTIWLAGFGLFSVAAVAVIATSLAAPGLLISSGNPTPGIVTTPTPTVINH